MTPAARLSAAIEVLADMAARRRPVADALKDWGLSHRFAGSGDRAAIAGLVYDTLRRRASAAALMGAETPRALLLGALHLARGWPVERIAALCSGERFAPEPLSEAEAAALARTLPEDVPAFIRGDYPEWLDDAMAAAFGDDRAAEGAALAARAPVDLRVNRLKAEFDKAQAELAPLGAGPTPHAADGLRIAVPEDGRSPAVQAEAAFQKGWVEIQDEGSQLAALLSRAVPGEQVVDLCAGAGGKTLALAAMMDNRGQIFATDSDKRRLAPIYDRLTRAGVRNVQVRPPRGRDDEPLADLVGRCDLVFVDAPCTGSGTWRRNPDAKWRVRPNALADRVADQARVLDRAAQLLKPGGRIVYVTCSVFPAENDDAIRGILARDGRLASIPPAEVAAAADLPRLAEYPSAGGFGLQLSPRRTGTDGFYVALLQRR